MTTKAFSKKEALQFGWNTMKANIGFFIGVLLAVWAISVIPGVINSFIDNNVVLALVVALLFRLVQWFLEIGLIRIALGFADGQRPMFPVLFSGKEIFLKYVGGTILYGLIVFGGILIAAAGGLLMSLLFPLEAWWKYILLLPLIALIAVGVFLAVLWSIQFFFYSYIVVDKGTGPIEALKQSSAMTVGVKWELFLFGLVTLGVNLLGALCLLVGLFATVPTTLVGLASIYRKLQARSGASA